jgi:hypothetical protein
MSLFAILYAADPPTPEQAIAAAFPSQTVQVGPQLTRIQTGALEATAKLRVEPNFDLELFGFKPTVSIYFAIDKERSVGARQQLATAVRSFLSSVPGDAVVSYLDTIVLKRQGLTSICAIAYSDLLPNGGAGWTMVQELKQP